jgi:replicative DNA helicase
MMATRHWPEDAERAVLGAILGAGCVDVDVGLHTLRRARATGLHPTDFGLASYGHIYEAMLRLEEEGLPVDPISVGAELDRNHMDPRAVSRLHIIARELYPFTAIERYARIVVCSSGRRESEERGAA